MPTIDEVIHRYMRERESKRHTLVEEDLAKERIQKDRDIAEVRRQTAKEIADIRSKAGKDRFELGQIVEDRKSAELDWKIARSKETDARKQSELDQKYALKDRELAQRQIEQSQKVEHWTTQEELAREKYENPPPAKPPMDRIEIMLPDGSKQVIHRGQPGWDAYQKQQEDLKRETEAQTKADESRNWWQKFRGVHIPIPPTTGTNPPTSFPIAPGGSRSMIPPPMPDTSTGTSPTIPIAPSQIPRVGNGMTAPAMTPTNTALPGIGRQLVAPPLPPSDATDDDLAGFPVASPQLMPASDYIVTDPTAVPLPNTSSLIQAAPVTTPSKKVRVKGPGGKSGTVPDGAKLPEGWSFE